MDVSGIGPGISGVLRNHVSKGVSRMRNAGRYDEERDSQLNELTSLPSFELRASYGSLPKKSANSPPPVPLPKNFLTPLAKQEKRMFQPQISLEKKRK